MIFFFYLDWQILLNFDMLQTFLEHYEMAIVHRAYACPKHHHDQFCLPQHTNKGSFTMCTSALWGHHIARCSQLILWQRPPGNIYEFKRYDSCHFQIGYVESTYFK